MERGRRSYTEIHQRSGLLRCAAELHRGEGGYWVAQKVPEGEVFVAANEFRIREIDPENPDQIHSQNLFRDAETMGWWKPADGPLDWTRGIWRGRVFASILLPRPSLAGLDKIAPSLNLSPYVEGPFTKKYPFSVVPDEPINLTAALDSSEITTRALPLI